MLQEDDSWKEGKRYVFPTKRRRAAATIAELQCRVERRRGESQAHHLMVAPVHDLSRSWRDPWIVFRPSSPRWS